MVAKLALVAPEKWHRDIMRAVLLEMTKTRTVARAELLNARAGLGQDVVKRIEMSHGLSELEKRQNVTKASARYAKVLLVRTLRFESEAMRKMYSCRVTAERLDACIAWVMKQMTGTICAGVTRTSNFEGHSIGTLAFFERKENIEMLLYRYRQEKSRRTWLSARSCFLR